MSMSTLDREHRLLDLKREEELEYRLISWIVFLPCLFLATVSLFLPRRWKLLPDSGRKHRTVFGQAWAAVHTIVPFAFMR